MKKLSTVMAAALVAALFVGAAVAVGSAQDRHVANRQGLMPEVVVTAEMPRLVMPTVEVRAMRTVAMNRQSLLVN